MFGTRGLGWMGTPGKPCRHCSNWGLFAALEGPTFTAVPLASVQGLPRLWGSRRWRQPNGIGRFLQGPIGGRCAVSGSRWDAGRTLTAKSRVHRLHVALPPSLNYSAAATATAPPPAPAARHQPISAAAAAAAAAMAAHGPMNRFTLHVLVSKLAAR